MERGYISMLRFFEPELVSSAASNRLRRSAWESKASEVRNDAALPLLSSSLLTNNPVARITNVSPGTERLNAYSGSFQLNTFSSAPSINSIPGQPTSKASSDHAMDMNKYNARTDRRKQMKQPATGETSVRRESKRHRASRDDAKQQNPLLDGSSQAQGAAKKSQKLGDKITALQQLVSPFGKTDTASVLQEAGVCIKVLHEQIQVLSSPYFGLEPSTALRGNAGLEFGLQERGLCVVPITSTIENLSSREPTDSFDPEGLGWGAGILHH